MSANDTSNSCSRGACPAGKRQGRKGRLNASSPLIDFSASMVANCLSLRKIKRAQRCICLTVGRQPTYWVSGDCALTKVVHRDMPPVHVTVPRRSARRTARGRQARATNVSRKCRSQGWRAWYRHEKGSGQRWQSRGPIGHIMGVRSEHRGRTRAGVATRGFMACVKRDLDV